MKKTLLVLSVLCVLALIALPVAAQDAEVTVFDQLITDGTVTIAEVVSPAAGFIVIHADDGSGAPGPVIGNAPVDAGSNEGVVVAIDVTGWTAPLYAMLHEDTGEAGVYEFGEVEGADAPVFVNDAVVSPSFVAPFINIQNVAIPAGRNAVIFEGGAGMAEAGWLVIHSDNGEGGIGPVIGQTRLDAGRPIRAVNVPVNAAGVTPLLFPMLHLDDGEIGVYEFGSVEGADAPLRVTVRDGGEFTGVVAVTQINSCGGAIGAAANANVRLLPSADSTVIGNAEAGAAVLLYGVSDDGGWYQIENPAAADGSSEVGLGWVSADLVDAGCTAPDLLPVTGFTS